MFWEFYFYKSEATTVKGEELYKDSFSTRLSLSD